MTRPVPLAVVGLLALGALAGCGRNERTAPPPAPPAATPTATAPEYVGTGRCAGCHAEEAARWRGSHHAAAMQIARPDTILGRPDAVVREGRAETRLRERDGRFLVRAEGPDGVPRDYEALYTFGVDPLQQLLLPLDRGRLQATTVAWDARPRAAGGQRWFALHGGEPLAPSDVLHWTGPAQRWNSMCADCHATNVRKRYDLAADAYATSWSELGVTCEACHGPGSRHAEWAEAAERGQPARAADRALPFALASDGARWVLEPGAPIARRSAPRTSHAEIDLCARCHARRTAIAAPAALDAAFLDAERPSLLDADLYTADGQIHDEVYEWGSFLQSRMYAAGVTCSDCHDPHSGRLRGEGDATCTQCHRADVFDVPAHHRHAPSSAASRCVSCHMPTRAYMVVDLRRDHSIRVPRPDLSAQLGTPNACNACHADRSAQWAADAVARWYGPERRREPHFGEVLQAARSGAAGAEAALAALSRDATQPAIARATALLELAPRADAPTRSALEDGARDADPLVRLGVAEGAAGMPPEERLALLAPLLHDPLRAVRIAAARALVATPETGWTPTDRSAHAAALAEWRAAEEVNADRPESHVDLGALAAEQGDLATAKAEYETALRIGPWFVPAYLNYADLLRAEQRDDLGEPLLRRAIGIAPSSADAQHALGLLLVRTKRPGPALDALRRATELDPANERYAYVYAVALHAGGDTRRAIDFLTGFAARRPADRSVAALLAELRAGDAPH